MCGRYTLRTKLNLLLSQFAAEMAEPFDFEPRYNSAPTQLVPAVRFNQSGKRELVRLKWSLIPSWAEDKKVGSKYINARAETVATAGPYRAAYKKRRCLVLADGYYEWLREGTDSQPFVYEVDGDKPFALAGLWEWWPGPAGKDEPVESCTLITTDANKLASEVHDRMPVILRPDDYDAWLDPANEDREALQALLVPFSPKHMTARPVNRYVNNARNQGEKCIESPD